MARITRSLPTGLIGPWLLAVIGGGFVASILGLALLRVTGSVTLDDVVWWGGNLVAWTALCLLLAGTERSRIHWIVIRSARVVEFTKPGARSLLPLRELAAAATFFLLLLWNWFQAFGDATVAFALVAAVFGTVRVIRRSPFSQWQWIGTGLLLARQAAAAFAGPGSAWTAAAVWFEIVLWWLVTHRAVKREDEAIAARFALTRASYYIADGHFSLAEEQVRTALPLATTKEIAAAALQVLAASLTGQARLAEARRALEGSLKLNPDDEEIKKQIEEIRRLQLV